MIEKVIDLVLDKEGDKHDIVLEVIMRYTDFGFFENNVLQDVMPDVYLMYCISKIEKTILSDTERKEIEPYFKKLKGKKEEIKVFFNCLNNSTNIIEKIKALRLCAPGLELKTAKTLTEGIISDWHKK